MKKLLVGFCFNTLELGMCLGLVLIAGIGVASITKSKPLIFAALIPSTIIAIVVSEKAVKKLR